MVSLVPRISAYRQRTVYYLSDGSMTVLKSATLRSSFSLLSSLLLIKMTPCYSVFKTMSPFSITFIWSWSSTDMSSTILRINSASSCPFEAAYWEESALSREAAYSSLKCWIRLVASCCRFAWLLDGSFFILISWGSLTRICVVVVSESTYWKHMISI